MPLCKTGGMACLPDYKLPDTHGLTRRAAGAKMEGKEVPPLTIQQVEEKTGITKKNIRFYEKEGLLKPARSLNQYRQYTQDEVDTLLQIRLLRSLGMSLEEIRLVLSGSTTLANGMRWHIGHLDEEIQGLKNTRALCKRILEEGRELDTLHTTEILQEVEEMEARGEGFFGVMRELAQRVRRVLPPTPVHCIEPKEVLATPADVDEAMIQYAVERGLDLTILRGNSFVPVVILDGQKLWGFCYSTRFGRYLALYRTQEESQYNVIGETNIKRVWNLFKKPKK